MRSMGVGAFRHPLISGSGAPNRINQISSASAAVVSSRASVSGGSGGMASFKLDPHPSIAVIFVTVNEFFQSFVLGLQHFDACGLLAEGVGGKAAKACG